MLYEKLIGNKKKWDKTIITLYKQTYTYRELHQAVNGCVKTLMDQGFDKEKNAVIFIQFDISTIIALLSCVYLGIPFILLDKETRQEKREYIYKLCKIRLTFGKEKNLISCNGNTFPICSFENTCVLKKERELINEERVGYILFTSGSTGIPKGVVAKQKQILFCLDRIQRRIQNTEDDIILLTLPLSFDYGLYQIFLGLLSGASLVWQPECLIQRIPSVLAKFKITAFPVVPTQFHLLMKTRLLNGVALPYLRYVCATGEKWDVMAIQAFHEKYPHVEILPMYGLTECKRVSIMPYGCYEKVRQGSCGVPLEDVEVVLNRKDEKTGIGELVVIGENVMEGYYGEDDSKQEIYRVYNGKRALYTGDLFKMDSEGFLYFVERKNNLIKRKGVRISCAEVEFYFQNEEDFLEICVVGIEDSLAGEEIALVIYSKNDCIMEQYQNITNRMPDILKPSIVKTYQAPLPRNNNGKICRKQIKEMIKRENES